MRTASRAAPPHLAWTPATAPAAYVYQIAPPGISFAAEETFQPFTCSLPGTPSASCDLPSARGSSSTPWLGTELSYPEYLAYTHPSANPSSWTDYFQTSLRRTSTQFRCIPSMIRCSLRPACPRTTRHIRRPSSSQDYTCLFKQPLCLLLRLPRQNRGVRMEANALYKSRLRRASHTSTSLASTPRRRITRSRRRLLPAV